MTESSQRQVTAPTDPSFAPRQAAVIEQSPRRGRRLDTLGWLAVMVGGACLGLSGNGPGWVSTALWAGGLLLAVAGVWVVLRGRRHRVNVLPGLRRLSEDERIVLFLRTFSDDAGFARTAAVRFRRLLLGGIQWTTPADVRTEEEQVSRALAPFGRMVALGRPSDRLPLPGAERSYSSDETWQAEVLTALNRANLVLLTAGPGESLGWEVDQVVRRNDPTRLVVVISRDQHQYAQFRESLGHLFPKGLPDSPAARIRQRILRGRYVRAVIWFEADWTPHLEMLDGRFPLISSARRTYLALPRALRQVYQRAGVPIRSKHATERRPRTVPVSMALFGTFWLGLEALYLLTTVVLPAAVSRRIAAISGGTTIDAVTTNDAFAITDFLGFSSIVLFPVAILAFWLYRVWRGGPYAIVMLQMYSIFVVVALVTLAVSLALAPPAWLVFGMLVLGGLMSLGFAPLLYSWLALLVLGVLGMPTAALLLIRRDVREWIESRQ